MKLHLIRHTKAEKRSDWDGPAALRPLTPRGLRQARALAEALAEAGIERIVSSPHLRCRQTLEPLASALGLSVELDDRLTEGASPNKALELLRELGDQPAACCSHGDLVPALVTALEERGAELRIDGPLRCEKGGRFLVEGGAEPPQRVSYWPPAGLASGADEAQRIGVLDLGSTSFRLVVFEATLPGRLVQVVNECSMLRLGASIALDGRIPPEVADEAAQTARALGRRARRAKVELLLPVATAALRDAANGDELRTRLGQELGKPVRLLRGEEEARLMFAAFRRRVLLGPGHTLGLDLGGGSLELAVGDTHDVDWEATLEIGVTRLQRQLQARDPMTREDADAVGEQVRRALKPHRAALGRRSIGTCVAVGGTARALVRLALARRGSPAEAAVPSLVIPREELRDITNSLVRSSYDERLCMPGMRRNRADLLPTGGLVFVALAEELGIEALTVCDWGLREGVVLEALASQRRALGV